MRPLTPAQLARTAAGGALLCLGLALLGRAQEREPSGPPEAPPAATPTPTPAPSPAPASALALGFLAGDWRSEDGGFRVHYTDPEGGMVLGVSKAVRGGEAVFFEFEVFSQSAAGGLVLKPYPGAKPAAAFQAGEVGPKSVEFLCPANDFPTRIVYACPSPDQLRITLEGEVEGRAQRESFVLERAPR